MHWLSPIAFRRLALRPLAVALAAFCMLAAGRAFVPNMCATQRSLPTAAELEAGAPCHLTPSGGCCGTVDSSAPADSPVAPGDAYCAFCYLAKAVAEAPVPIHFPTPSYLEAAEPDGLRSIVRCRELDHLLAGRAPPVIA